MDPLDEQQEALVGLVWPKIAETGRCPKYRWVGYMMRRQGYDAAQVLGSLPCVGTPDYRGRYSALWTTSSGGGAHQPVHDVGMTVAGLYHAKNDGAMRIIGGVCPTPARCPGHKSRSPTTRSIFPKCGSA